MTFDCERRAGRSLQRLVSRPSPQGNGRQSTGRHIQAAEWETAKQRLLALAEANRIPVGEITRAVPDRRWRRATRTPRCDDVSPPGIPRVAYGEYLFSVALTLAARHRPVWSWRRWRRVCRCGADLPCGTRHRIPISRHHWPTGEER